MSRGRFVVAVLLAVCFSSTLVLQTTYASFVATRTNAANSWVTGSVALSDDDGGSALFSTASDGTLNGTQSLTRCIVVQYGGSLTSAVSVKLFGAVSGALASYLDLTIDQGTGGGGGSCSGFTVGTAGIYSGTLAAFGSTATDYTTGRGSWTPTTTGATRSYRITLTVQQVSGAQGKSVTATFYWAARTSGFTGVTSTDATVATRSRFYPFAVLAAAPVSYWRLGEASGTTRVDQKGATSLTCTGVTLGAAGAISRDTDTGIRFPAVSAYCYAGSGSALSLTTPFTVLLWERTATWPATVRGRIVAKYGGANGTLNYMVAWDTAGTAMRALIDTNNGRYTATKAMPNDTRWHQVAMVWDGSVVRLYVDGSPADSVAAPGTPVTTNTAMTLGYNQSDSAVGDLDEVAVFSRALSAAEIADLYSLA